MIICLYFYMTSSLTVGSPCITKVVRNWCNRQKVKRLQVSWWWRKQKQKFPLAYRLATTIQRSLAKLYTQCWEEIWMHQSRHRVEYADIMKKNTEVLIYLRNFFMSMLYKNTYIWTLTIIYELTISLKKTGK